MQKFFDQQLISSWEDQENQALESSDINRYRVAAVNRRVAEKS